MMQIIQKINRIIERFINDPIKTINDIFQNYILGVVQLSYSSTGEDVILDWLIKKEKGFYVDIGSYDPIYGNNTYLFYKKGWTGINVEPNKQGFRKFIKKRKYDINLQVAVGTSTKPLTFHVFDSAAMSTCDLEAVQRYEKAGQKVIEKYVVPIMTLANIFDQYVKDKQIDILSIDVEGWDMDVLKSNNRHKYKPTYIVLETVEYIGNNKWEKQNDIFDKYLEGKGYCMIAETGINTIYKLKNTNDEEYSK